MDRALSVRRTTKMLAGIRHFHDGMRARIRTDDGECYGLVRRGAGPAARMRVRTIAVQHFIYCVWRSSGLVPTQIWRRIWCAARSRRKRRGGGEPEIGLGLGRDKPQETVAEPTRIWGMLCADDAGIISRSRNSLARTMGVIVAVRASFGLTGSGAKTETTCLMMKGLDRVTYVAEAAGQAHKQTAKDCVPCGNYVREC